jgi:hypothetical protein
MAAALQVWSATFTRSFDAFPAEVRDAVQSNVDQMGTRLESCAHRRLKGRPECRLRVGDYRVL